MGHQTWEKVKKVYTICFYVMAIFYYTTHLTVSISETINIEQMCNQNKTKNRNMEIKNLESFKVDGNRIIDQAPKALNI